MMDRTSLRLSYSKKLLLAIAAMVPILSVVLAASIRLPQVSTPLAFEAASVRPSGPGGGITWGWCRGTDSAEFEGGWIASRILQGMSPPARPALGRCAITRSSLKQILQAAYDLGPNVEITGGPGWFDSDRFDIDAKADDPSKATVADLQQMLQQLLADRFKLKFHRETKEVSGSLLVVAANGSKLKEAADSDFPPRGGRPGDMNFRGATMPVLAEFISQIMGRPVEDKTGLSGKYTFTLKWAPGETDIVPPEFAQPPDPSGPTLVTALQEQLGLRLQSGRVPVFSVVIDSAEKPFPN